MTVISHRGCWSNVTDKNSARAFARSFHFGFGTETDIRDLDGRLVVSHDPAQGGALPAEVLFEVHAGIDPALPLALNVKADGLHGWVRNAFDRFGLTNAFVFDMSVPDARGYLSARVPTFTRHSDLERDPPFYAAAAGVWMDGFDSDWLQEADISGHLRAGKSVCVVSSELHGRPHADFWDRLRRMACVGHPRLMLCTDLPEAAQEVFRG